MAAARSCLTLLFILLVIWVAPVQAATVAIMQPARQRTDLTETVSRLHGELLAVGLGVTLIDRSGASSGGQAGTRAWFERLAAARGFDAIIDIVVVADRVAVDVWIVDAPSRPMHLERVEVEPNTPNPSEKLAIRAIEVLRSRFLENDMAKRERVGEPGAQPSLPPPPPRPPPSVPSAGESLGVGAGVAAASSLDGVGPAIEPMVALDWTIGARLVAHAALTGPIASLGSHPQVATTAGSARVTQHCGTVGGRYRLASNHGLLPFVALSAGALRTEVVGSADAPQEAHTAAQWSLLAQGSMGTEFQLPAHYYLSLAAHVRIAEPYVAIHIADSTAATTGRPDLALTLTLGAWL